MLRPLGLALLLASGNCGWAQYVVSARAGTINLANGQVSVDDRPIERKSNKFPTLKDGQVLRTTNGRAELLLGPGVFLRLGPHSTLGMVNSRLVDTQVELQQGTALVEVIEIANGSSLHVVLGNSRTAFRGIGLHRFDADSGDLRVYGGHADVSIGAQTFDASRGRTIHLRDIPVESRFNPRGKDPLFQWAASRSFHLFVSNPAARARLSNWEVTNTSPGSDENRSYYFNPDFGVTFVSRIPGRSTVAPPPQFGDFHPRENAPSGSGNGLSTPGAPGPSPASGGAFNY